MIKCGKCEKSFNSVMALCGHQISHNGRKSKTPECAIKVVCSIYDKQEYSLRSFNNIPYNNCLHCDKEHIKSGKTNNYCSPSCSVSATNIGKIKSDDTKNKISNKLKSKNNRSKTKITRSNKDDIIVGEYTKLFKCKCNTCNTQFLSRNKRKYCNDHTLDYKTYRNNFCFTFRIFDYPDLFDLNNLRIVSFYNRKYNSKGFVKDHKFSALEAAKNNYDSYYITHPLNCELLTFIENSQKRDKCSITYEDLVIQVDEYDRLKSSIF